MTEEQEKALKKLENGIYNKYIDLAVDEMDKKCKFRNEIVHAPAEGSFELCQSNLKAACVDIVKDIKILLDRRGKLIGKNRPTRGKIAGITAFRLSRRHIVHIHPNCVNCKDDYCKKNRITLNNKLAICCAFHFIKKKYSFIDTEITNEIIYTMINRHMNQETLGIVFDTIKHYG